MPELQNPPLNWEASATTTNPQISSTLPSEVITCLKNARFVSTSLHNHCLQPSPSLLEYEQQLTISTAPPRNMHRPLSPHLPHELHLPPQHTLHSPPFHNNDHKPFLEENHQPHPQPSRLPPSPRLGFPPASDSSSRPRSRRLSTPSSHTIQSCKLASQHQHQCFEQHFCNDRRRSTVGGAGQRGREVV